MKVESREGSRERRVLCGMVLNETILGRIAPLWKGEEFASKWGNIIGGWCVAYYKNYQKAPGKEVTSLYESWRTKNRFDDETIQTLESVLEILSEEAETSMDDYSNADFLLDQAVDYFNFVRADKTKREIEGSLDLGDTKEALARYAGFRPIELSAQAGSDLFLDEEEVRDTFNVDLLDPLVLYKGALGRMLNPYLVRDSFISFVGPEKSCKSFMLQDLAFRAMIQRRRVAYFEVGDMSRRQVKRRFLTRAARHPIHSDRWPFTVRYPISISKGPEIAHVEYKTLNFDRPLDGERAWKTCVQTMQETVKSKRSFFRLSVHPNSTINVEGIRAILESWDLEGWVPDVIILDYADILAAPSGRMDRREAIDVTWKQLRSLSTEKHALVATATQANANSYNKRTLDRSNFSESKTKNAHITLMAGINQTMEEKEAGIIRINIIVGRDREFSPRRCVHVATCLPLAMPTVCSTFWNDAMGGTE